MLLTVLGERLAICRLSCDAPLPGWGTESRWFSATRTLDELSVVCPEEAVPAGFVCSKGWRSLKVEGPLNLAMTGVLASLAGVLAAEGLSLFAVSTFDTDYLLVREGDLDAAIRALIGVGHKIEGVRPGVSERFVS